MGTIIKVIIPEERLKIEKQIKALESVLKRDANEKDRKIHQEAKKALEAKLSTYDK